MFTHFSDDFASRVIFRAAVFGYLPLTFLIGMLAPCTVRGAEHVIHISVDGLNAQMLQDAIDAGDAPTFKRLRDEGAWTNNSRTDFTHTVTLPNHTSMITSRPVLRPKGMKKTVYHNWTLNDVPQRNTTLHNNNPNVDYVGSTFDVAHDAGLSTALYTSKDKFVIYDQSYNETGGADNPHGRDKIDVYFFQDDGPPNYSATMNERFLTDLAARHFQYAFVHYRDTDSAGHAFGWGGSAYRQAIKSVDGYLAAVLRLVESDKKLAGRTAIILTTDHGGIWFNHGDPAIPPDYTIPMIVWGAGVGHGDLYKINAETRTDPGEDRPDYNAAGQPIRNGDTGNLALSLLGLGPVSGSLINAKQDLRVALAGDYNLDGSVDAADQVIWQETDGSATDLRADGNRDGRVDQADYDLWKAHFGQTAVPAPSSGS
ncbi:MAG: alkaline phosphatase family protein [Pirellulales bacterium]